VAEIGDLANSGVRRVNTQVFGVRSRETRGAEKVSDPGPQKYRVSSKPSDLRGTRGARFGYSLPRPSQL
jgi:hypothetical protein